MRAVVLTTLVGCGFSGPALDEVDAAAADASAEAIDGALIDSDDDGTPDATDNCPEPNDQANFDGDARGDVCDPCPHLADDDADPDGDGIGAGCDPRPTEQDTRLLWTSFDAVDPIAGWNVDAGTWVVQDGRLWQTDPDVAFGIATPPLGTSLGRLSMAMRFELVTLGPRDGTIPSHGVGMASARESGRYNACIVHQGVTSPPALLAASNWPGGAGSSSADEVMWTGTFTTSSQIALVHDTSGSNHCAASQVTAQAPVSLDVSTDRDSVTTGMASMYTQRAAAAFDYLFIVEIGD